MTSFAPSTYSYAPSEYAGIYDEVGAWLNSTGSGGGLKEGFYVDVGGYGWYWNGVTNGSLDLVFAPGGGQRITFPKGDARTKTIFERVVKPANPITKETLAAKVVARNPHSKETTGKAVDASIAAGAGWASLVNGATYASDYIAPVGGDKPELPAAPRYDPPAAGGGSGGGGGGDGGGGAEEPFYTKPWFPFAVAGGVVAIGLVTYALWPSKPKT